MVEFRDGFTTLPGRGVIRVAGPDRRAFLDALVSNDLGLLDTQGAVYACLLTPQGKFLFDFFVATEGESLLLDVEGGARLAELARKLTMYRLRSRVEIAAEDGVPVYAAANKFPGAARDPRHADLGWRGFAKPDGAELPFEAWDAHRIRLGVPDGSRDMEVGQASLIECGVDRLHGVSFAKGCYIGQELTARMHHRGLAKKHLRPVAFDGPPPATGADLTVAGAFAGTMRSSCGHIGIAMLKDEAAATLRADPTLARFRPLDQAAAP